MDRHAEFLRLYNAAQSSLRGYLLAWLGDFHRAEDMLQETSLVLWQHFAKFRPGESFTAWALGIARNLTLKEMRNRQSTPSPLARPEVMEAVAKTYAREAPELEARRRSLVGCMEKLSSALRSIVDLYYGQSMKIAEVAKATGRSPGGIEVSLARARRFLETCTERSLRAEP